MQIVLEPIDSTSKSDRASQQPEPIDWISKSDRASQQPEPMALQNQRATSARLWDNTKAKITSNLFWNCLWESAHTLGEIDWEARLL